MRAQVETRMTAAAFFELPESLLPVELLDGEVIMSPAPELAHQDIVLAAALLLKNLVCEGNVYVAPVDVHLDEQNVVQPDVLWAGASGACVAVAGKHLRGAPDLIVEVFSPGSISRDKKRKFHLYEQHGVREYWMIDPLERYIEVHRHENGRFVLQGVYEPEDTFESAALGGKPVAAKTILGEKER